MIFINLSLFLFENQTQKDNEKTLKSELEDSGEICGNKMFDKMIKYMMKKINK